MILVDLSSICVQNFFGLKNDYSSETLKHLTLFHLNQYYKKFHKEYGYLTIACDYKTNWRTDIFPEYKQNRKKKKAQVDWKDFHTVRNEMIEEFIQIFKFPVIHVESCEADDIIGVLCLNSNVIEPIMIISADHDFISLHSSRVKQYSNIFQKFIRDPNPVRYLNTKILKGDSGDGIPNILSDGDTFLNESKRQTPLRQTRIDKIIKNDIVDVNELSKQEYKNYCRNLKMIKLTETPKHLKDAIWDAYKKQQQKKKVSLFKYVSKNTPKLISIIDELDRLNTYDSQLNPKQIPSFLQF